MLVGVWMGCVGHVFCCVLTMWVCLVCVDAVWVCEVGWASGWVNVPGAKWLLDFPFENVLVS